MRLKKGFLTFTFPIAVFIILIGYLGWVSFSSVSSIIKPPNAQALESSQANLAEVQSNDVLPAPAATELVENLPDSLSGELPVNPAGQDSPLPDSSHPIITGTLLVTQTNLTAPLGATTSGIEWGNWSCAFCMSVPVKIRLTHYWPPLGGENCWSFHDSYCYSPTKSSIPWETMIEIGAACTKSWLGTIVEVPSIARRFICLDTGYKVLCKDAVCAVDVLTDKLYPWDGMITDAIVYYPRIWVEGSVPTPTPSP